MKKILFSSTIMILSLVVKSQFYFNNTFAEKQTLYPNKIACGDINNDGNMDVICSIETNVPTDKINIYLGDGSGHLTRHDSILTNWYPGYTFVRDMIITDFNNDSYKDLVLAEGNNVRIFTGNNQGNFVPYDTIYVGNGCKSIVATDLNSDGEIDLVTANNNHTNNRMSILLGNGIGNFTVSNYLTGYDSYDIAVGDVNNDGKLDIITSNDQTGNDTIDIVVFLGDGQGGIITATSYNFGDDYNTILLKDFNNDGKLDIAANEWSGTGDFSILRGNGNGTFQALSPTDRWIGNQILSFDFDGDNKMDILSNAYPFFIHTGKGDCTFNNKYIYNSFDADNIENADFNNDGRQDIITTSFSDSTIRIYINQSWLAGIINIESNSISVSPNPTCHFLTIYPKEVDSYCITDILGQSVLKGTYTKIIDISTLANGTYFLHGVINGQQYQTKFIKE